ncbi:MAG: HD domain-containing phosphohydrolase [Syntrophobacter sp.]
MTEKILFVDDDSNILAAFRRQLRKQFTIETAPGGGEGLEAVKNSGPFAVIVSDLRMPRMDGIEFLSRVRALAPDSVRMMLTGNADLHAAVEAVNQGHIFRFLTKPCGPEVLTAALNSGTAQYRLITAERELLEKTLRGTIKVLGEMLALLNPEAFGRASRITRYVKEVAQQMGAPDVWQLETAAALSQIGCIMLPEDALMKLYKGQPLAPEESQLFNMHPFLAYDLLSHIPRMEEIAEIISYQEKHFDGSGIPHDDRHGKEIPLGSRILKVVLDFDTMVAGKVRKGEIIVNLKSRSGIYDPRVLAALEALVVAEEGFESRAVTVAQLRDEMILAQDVTTIDGRLLLVSGYQVNKTMRERLRNFAVKPGVKEPIHVLVPIHA